MKRISITLACALIAFYSFGQGTLTNVKSKKFKTSEGLKIEGEVGYLEVPENRKNPSSRKIKTKYVRLKSLAQNPATPVIYLEGGGGQSTWEASSPRDLNDRLELLEVADLIYLDRRGASDKALTYIWKEGYPMDFFISEDKATHHLQKMATLALEKFEEKNVDVLGYNIEEHAHDVNDLMSELGYDRYTVFGFSYGSHIGMTVMNLYPERVARAILVGADAPNQSFNFPRHLDEHVDKIGALIEQEASLQMTASAFKNLVYETLQKVRENPAVVTVRNPLTLKKFELPIGAFGLGLILRLDIDDAYDIPAIPRLLYSINQGDYSMLTWFVQKRMKFALGIPGQGINQQLASGVSGERWSTIKEQARASAFGNVVNFPFAAVIDQWPATPLSFDPSIAVQSDIPTLFVTGTLDCRTPVEQVEITMEGFTNAAHIKVENAGHEQAQWQLDVANKLIPSFLKGETIESATASYRAVKFIPLTGEASGHVSIK